MSATSTNANVLYETVARTEVMEMLFIELLSFVSADYDDPASVRATIFEAGRHGFLRRFADTQEPGETEYLKLALEMADRLEAKSRSRHRETSQ